MTVVPYEILQDHIGPDLKAKEVFGKFANL